MELKTGYKQTEVGVIPSDWDIVKVHELGEVKRGAGSQYTIYAPESNGIRFIRINDFFENNPVFVQPTSNMMRFCIHQDDILFAGTGNSAGASFIPPKDWIGLPFSYNSPRIRTNKKTTKQFLLYCLQSGYLLRQQKSFFVGAAQPFLDTRAIANFDIALPPTLAEQTAIATALSDTDQYITHLEKLIAKKRNIKQGAMQELLKPKEGWVVKKLGELGESIIGLTYKPENVKSDGKLVLRSSNIQGGLLVFDDNVFVDALIPDKLILQENDILICVRNGSRDLIGKCALITGPAVGETFGAFMSVFRSGFNPFLVHIFKSDIIKKQIEEHLGATINQITNKSLNSFEVTMPENEKTRNQIAAILSDMDSEIAALEAKLSKAKSIKQGMMQQLLTGKIRLIN